MDADGAQNNGWYLDFFVCLDVQPNYFCDISNAKVLGI